MFPVVYQRLQLSVLICNCQVVSRMDCPGRDGLMAELYLFVRVHK